MGNEKNKVTGKNIIIAVLVALLLIASGYIGYGKFLKNKNESKNIDNCPKCEVCEKCENNVTQCNCQNNAQNNGEQITSLKEIKLTSDNQIINIGSRQIKIKIGNDNHLYIDDYSWKFSVYHAYQTNKFIIFTNLSQDGEMIELVYGENGKIVANNNEYQMHDFKVVDGYLHASGHIFGGDDGNGPDKDLIIKYIDNTLIVVPA